MSVWSLHCTARDLGCVTSPLSHWAPLWAALLPAGLSRGFSKATPHSPAWCLPQDSAFYSPGLPWNFSSSLYLKALFNQSNDDLKNRWAVLRTSIHICDWIHSLDYLCVVLILLQTIKRFPKDNLQIIDTFDSSYEYKSWEENILIFGYSSLREPMSTRMVESHWFVPGWTSSSCYREQSPDSNSYEHLVSSLSQMMMLRSREGDGASWLLLRA